MKLTDCKRGSKVLLIILLCLVVTFCCAGWPGNGSASASADETSGTADVKADLGEAPAEYHTPLAGEAGQVEFMGRTVLIPALERAHMTSITLGGSLLMPKQGDTPGLPIAALYVRHFWEESSTRNVISIFVNELEYAKSFGNMELVGHFENYTLPMDQTELVHNEEIESTSLRWGTLTGSFGPGLRIPIAPFQVDNDIRLQLLGRVRYFYAKGTGATGPGLVVPPDTMLYGVKLRARYDAMRRNLLELPHQGFAAGCDLDYLHRDKWRDLEPMSAGSKHRNYFQASGYFVGAGGIPGLSERDRVLVSFYGGTTNGNSADRFNAFLINGGPFSSEQEDLARVHYTGGIYEDVRATDYATASLGYRRELAFFLYLSAVGSYIWADRATVRGLDQVFFSDESAAAFTVSLDSGFLWNSSLYLAYSWDSSFIRGGKSGSGVVLTWNKLF